MNLKDMIHAFESTNTNTSTNNSNSKDSCMSLLTTDSQITMCSKL